MFSKEVKRRSILKSLALTAAGSAVPAGWCGAQTGPGHEPLPDQPQPSTDLTARNLYLNQVGYRPAQSKIATVILVKPWPSGRDRALPLDPAARAAPPDTVAAGTFQVRSISSHEVVMAGSLSSPKLDAASGDTVALADLSSLRTPGQYRVEVRARAGDTFTISENVHAEPLRLAIRAFYGQRCGCAVDLGNGYKHPACHADGVFGESSGRAGKVLNAGGWHDAGDYGRYVVNSGITCGTLLWAWEMFPDALRTMHLDLPESGKALPDFLAEVKWNLNWMLSMQDPTDGGVWHKQTSARFSGFLMPEKDGLPSEVIGTGSAPFKSTCATADLASVMAVAARCYEAFDPTFAARCLEASRHAFRWAQSNGDVAFRNPAGVTTGEYGDRKCSDELLWASAELFRTTGEATFEKVFLDAVAAQPADLPIDAPSWENVSAMGLWTYALAQTDTPNSTARRVRDSTRKAASLLLARSVESGYGNTLALADYHWGSNSSVGNHSLLLIVAHLFEPNRAALDAAVANLDYLLGRNCFGISWVTQVGVRPYLHPHHRPSVADGIAAPWPGMLSGGPNAFGGDEVANRTPLAAPMRMWVDDERAYSLNEIAINWNAPLVFTLAASHSSLLKSS